MEKLVFCELDNTLITTRSGKNYPLTTKDWKFIDNTIGALQILKEKLLSTM